MSRRGYLSVECYQGIAQSSVDGFGIKEIPGGLQESEWLNVSEMRLYVINGGHQAGYDCVVFTVFLYLF